MGVDDSDNALYQNDIVGLPALSPHILPNMIDPDIDAYPRRPRILSWYNGTRNGHEWRSHTHIGTIDFDRTEKPFVLGVKGMTQSETFRYWLVVTEILLALYRSAELGRTARFGQEELGHRVPLMACSS